MAGRLAEEECRICSPETHSWDGGPSSWAQAWEAWRFHYDDLSFAEQRAFSERIYDSYPDQEHWSQQAWDAFFRPLALHGSVCELGGYDGSLARHALAAAPSVTSWTNYELYPRVAEISVCDDARYHPVALSGWFWAAPLREPADLFVATHTIEHLRSDQVEASVEVAAARLVYFEAPLAPAGQDWQGYSATHRLEQGWDWVADMMRRHGYAAGGAGDCRWYTR